jgi:hypothetical protein
MKQTTRYFFLLIIFLVTTSFIHKDLNEYGKWLKFHGINGDDFKQIGLDRTESFEWTYLPRIESTNKVYFSVDSMYFVDLWPLYYDKDSNLVSNPHFNSAQIVRSKDPFSCSLLSFGVGSGYTETAIWRNNILFEIFGFEIKNKVFIPTIWKYDLQNKTSKVFQCSKTFKSRPESYSP